MAIQKRYFIWKSYKETPKYYSHPNTQRWKKAEWEDLGIYLQEYEYNNGAGWYLAHIEWDDSLVAGSTILAHADNFIQYRFEVKTPAETITLLNQMYPPADGDDDYFSLDQDGWTIIDNRPIEVDSI